MSSISVNVDVPSLEAGVRFYEAAFGFAKVGEPYPGVAELRAGALTVYLLEKAAGSRPAPGASDERRYGRHWTPVHLDFHADDFAAAVARAVAAGAQVEQRIDDPEHGSIAFCCDPFGHGFCVLAAGSAG